MKNKSVEIDLKRETAKWTKRIEKEIKNVRLRDASKKQLLENIRAYIDDSKYFTKKGDPIRAFEAIIWGWAWLEILRELDVLK
ncbi:MAG: DUF357 domain-containing protein [Candidatus Aenigmarchaeota archaeon]|nr:DUF357 domain-containing protein [Candidatus Aenigmarchaeota archaeon]